jgi:hypothetical protein
LIFNQTINTLLSGVNPELIHLWKQDKITNESLIQLYQATESKTDRELISYQLIYKNYPYIIKRMQNFKTDITFYNEDVFSELISLFIDPVNLLSFRLNYSKQNIKYLTFITYKMKELLTTKYRERESNVNPSVNYELEDEGTYRFFFSDQDDILKYQARARIEKYRKTLLSLKENELSLVLFFYDGNGLSKQYISDIIEIPRTTIQDKITRLLKSNDLYYKAFSKKNKIGETIDLISLFNLTKEELPNSYILLKQLLLQNNNNEFKLKFLEIFSNHQ